MKAAGSRVSEETKDATQKLNQICDAFDRIKDAAARAETDAPPDVGVVVAADEARTAGSGARSSSEPSLLVRAASSDLAVDDDESEEDSVDSDADDEAAVAADAVAADDVAVAGADASADDAPLFVGQAVVFTKAGAWQSLAARIFLRRIDAATATWISPRRRVAATPRPRRGIGRGDAAADDLATLRGISTRRPAAAPRPVDGIPARRRSRRARARRYGDYAFVRKIRRENVMIFGKSDVGIFVDVVVMERDFRSHLKELYVLTDKPYPRPRRNLPSRTTRLHGISTS